MRGSNSLHHYLQLTTSNTVKASLISSSATKESIFPATMNRKSGNLREVINISVIILDYENYDIAIAMSSSRADPVLGHCPGWGYLNI